MLNAKNQIKTSNQDKPNILATLKLEQALRLAKKKMKKVLLKKLNKYI